MARTDGSNSLRSRFTVVSRWLVLFPLVVFGLALLGVVILGVHRVTIHRQQIVAEYTASHLESSVRSYQRLLARLSAVNDLSAAPRERRVEALTLLVQDDELIERIVLADASGRETVRVSDVLASHESQSGGPSPGDPVWAHSEAYRRTVGEGKVYAGEFIISRASGEPLLRISVPLKARDAESVSGAVIAELRLRVVRDALSQLPLREHESAYVLDGDGNVIEHTVRSMVTDGTRRPVPLRSGFVHGLDGRIVLLSHAAIEIGGSTFYGVVEQHMFGPYAPLILVVAAAAVIFALVFHGIVRTGAWIRVNVIDGLEEVARVARAMGTGDLHARVYRRGPAELETVGEALNALAESTAREMEELRHSLRERDTLLREVHHRVKNNLQIISSMIRLQADGVSDPDASTAVLATQRRVTSIALVHEYLHRSDSLSRIRFDTYLESLSAHIIQHYRQELVHVSLETEIEPRALHIDEAIPCGLILSEALANSMRHAFPGGRRGTVRVRFYSDDRSAVLEIGDDGDGGAPSDADVSGGIGMMLMRALAEQLRGHLSVESAPGGTLLRLRFTPETDHSSEASQPQRG